MSRSLIVITRPLQEALVTATQYEVMGYSPLIAPMVEIIPREENRKILEEWKYDPPKALWVTSQNSLCAVADCPFLFSIPLVTVGDKTAQEAKKMGFLRVTSCSGNAQAMIAFIEKTYHAQAGAFLYLSGNKVYKDLALHFNQKGWNVTRAVMYDTQPVEKIPALLEKALKKNTVKGITFFSTHTAEITMNFMKKEEAEAIEAYSLSENITETLSALPWKRIVTAKAPTQRALFALF